MSDRIAHYNILSTLGGGALGPVYRARDTVLGRTVAIRVITDGMDDPARRARALDLIRPYTALTHQHVASLFEAGEQRGSIYLVYEFVPGERLNAALAGQPMNVRRALDLAAQMADALAEAHALGLVHGSVTASNVMVTPKGHAKILDFGLTAGLPEAAGDHLEALGAADRQAARVETLGRSRVGYAAPEQLLGQKADQRSDIFALGALLHEMVTGRHAFAGRTILEVGVNVLRAQPAAPSAHNPGVPRAVDRIVARAMAKKPIERYQDAVVMAAQLRDAAADVQGQATAREPEDRRRTSPFRLTLLATMLLAAGALAAWQWRDPLRQAWESRFGRPPEPVLVVLPYYVGPENNPRPYYGAGLSEELARRLARVPGIKVLGQSSIRAMAGKPPQAAASAVGAKTALTGTLTPADDDWTSMTLETRLTDTRDGRVIWSGSHKTAAQDVMALQAGLTREIAARLLTGYQPSAEQGRAALRLVNPSAYDKYLEAREAMASYDASRAVQLFDAAAIEDPSLIEAQAGMAEALYMLSVFEQRDQFGRVRERARQAAEAAFAADPDLAITRLAMGLTAASMPDALEQLRRAVEIEPSFSAAYLALADTVRPFSPGRAAGFVQRALDLEPAQPLVFYQLAAANLAAGSMDSALLAVGRGQSLAPALPWWDAFRDRIALARAGGAELAAGTGAREAGDFPPGIIVRAAALGAAGRAADAATLAATLVRRHPDSCEARAMLAAVLVKGERAAEGARAAAEIAARAAAAPDGSGLAGCAAMAAAAVSDPARAAAALRRVAASGAELRAWSLVNPLSEGFSALKQSVFPWSNVAAAPAVAAALAEIEAAHAAARAEAARILQGM
jgi:TolB-like protein